MNQGKYTFEVESLNGDEKLKIIVNAYSGHNARTEATTIMNITNQSSGFKWNVPEMKLISFETMSAFGQGINGTIESHLLKIADTLSEIRTQGEAKF